MLSDELLEALRGQGEGVDLDYKAERYPFAKAGDDDKSKMLKDILAMANAPRAGDGHILIGFKEIPGFPAEVCGLPEAGHVDDSRVQEFVNGKLESKLQFKYEEQQFQGQRIAVITIPKQPRPFYATKSFGTVAADTVYLRRGSATGIATPREIYRMAQMDQSRGEALLNVAILDGFNRPLGRELELSFLSFDEPPEYRRSGFAGYRDPGSFLPANRHYWREGAEHLVAKARMVRVRLMVTNRSSFALTNAKFEVQWLGGELPVKLLTASDLPVLPTKDWSLSTPAWGGTRTEVDEEGPSPVFLSRLGDLHPGETGRAGDDLIFLPPAPGAYTMHGRVLAAELVTPFAFESSIVVRGEQRHLTFDELQDMLDAESDDLEESSDDSND